jgi:phospholipid transport system substrate-binding protein
MKTSIFTPFILLLYIASSCVVHAAAMTDAQRLHDIIEIKSAVILEVIHDNTIDRLEKNSRILAAVGGLINFDLMAKLSIGKTGWQQLTEPQQAEYVMLFSERVKYMYLGSLYNLTGQDIYVDPARQLGKECIAVPSNLVNGRMKTEVLYKFYPTKQDAWLIYDIKINGVSMVQAYRSDFSSYMGRSCATGLINQLRENKID